IIPGIELSLPAGKWGLHIIALGVDQYISFVNILGAIEKLKKLKAVLILPHPFKEGTGLFYHVSKKNITKEEQKVVLNNISYVEALNMKDTCFAVERSLGWSLKQPCPIVSGTDAHNPEYVGMSYTEIDNLKSLLSPRKNEKTNIVAPYKAVPKNIHTAAQTLQTATGIRYKWHEPPFQVVEKYISKLYFKDKRLRKGAVDGTMRKSEIVSVSKRDKKFSFSKIS
ncbi:MAG: hypothetical protein LN364_02205, partial [Candidatus Thermoplasmatota archaeon]|nr:hypothetical protein [Candidatus Thermoplasmatota archaeon]